MGCIECEVPAASNQGEGKRAHTREWRVVEVVEGVGGGRE